MRMTIVFIAMLLCSLLAVGAAISWGVEDNGVQGHKIVKKKLVFPFEMGFLAIGIRFDGEKQEPALIVGLSPEPVKEHEVEVYYPEITYLFFMPLEPANFDDERLKTSIGILKESGFPHVGFRFEGCGEITVDGLSALQELDTFSCVGIDGRNASPRLLALDNLPELEVVFFHASEKTTLDDFRRLPRLRKSLKWLSIELHDWPNNDQTDELIDVICKLDGLRRLEITSKPLPIESVRKLKSISSLKRLRIVTPVMMDGTPCPPDVLKADFPGVEVWQTDYKDLPAIEE